MLENSVIDDAVVVDGDVVTVDIARLVVILKSSGQDLDKILWDHETLGLRQMVSKIIHARLKTERNLPVEPPVVFRFEGGKFRKPETDAEIIARARLGSPRMSEFVPKGN